MTPDAINGLFELAGAACVWVNVLRLHHDRAVRGIAWPTMAFFAAWGCWNLWYYPNLGQWLSFGAGLILVAGNVVWVGMAIGNRAYGTE